MLGEDKERIHSPRFLINAMTISYSEEVSLTCPTCGASIPTTVWVLLDTEEHPEQREALRQGQINTQPCSQCGTTFAASTALMLHDRQRQWVVFALPQGKAEHVWREQARILHEQLIERLSAEDQNASYLGEVQIAQDVQGIAHLLTKQERQRRNAGNRQRGGQVVTGDGRVWEGMVANDAHTEAEASPYREVWQESGPQPSTRVMPEMVTPDPQRSEQTVLQLVHQLLTVDSLESLREMLTRYPMLQTAAADRTLQLLTNFAFEERSYDLAESLNRVRLLIQQVLAQTRFSDEQVSEQAQSDHDHEEEPLAFLPQDAYYAILTATSTNDLRRVVQDYPVVLEPWFDAALGDVCDQVLQEGDVRMAMILEYRREIIFVLRQEIGME